MSLEYARQVADAVLYEGYLLYPYRASSGKNQSRWQFGVLGPPGALETGRGEDPAMATQFLLRATGVSDPGVTVRLRFLQLQQRRAQSASPAGDFRDVAELAVNGARWLSWDEAVEQEITVGPWSLAELGAERVELVGAPDGADVELVRDEHDAAAGRLVRSRHEVRGELRVRAQPVEGAPDLVRLSIRVDNVTSDAAEDNQSAIAASFIGAHLLVSATDGEFVSMTDPPDDAAAAVDACTQHRCWPVLAGPSGERSLMLASPIILYDHPEIAAQSAGALFDSTEIDEILTLRVMTLTDEEKAAARATDPRAAEIIDRCDAMSPDAMQQLHGILRDPHALDSALIEPFEKSFEQSIDSELPWWDPGVDASVNPQTDAVLINGVSVTAGNTVRIHPSRRADAQDLFFADQVARVAAVHSDVDGETHVAVVLVDDPAADLHDWYGRYLYFAPDELEPMPAIPPSSPPTDHREESRP
ncbi:MAG: hypothetical protein M3070_04640 [Actinomycetota bacterium]|nr:hypothetical protein [Actinomycetota bacterium]